MLRPIWKQGIQGSICIRSFYFCYLLIFNSKYLVENLGIQHSGFGFVTVRDEMW